MIPLIGLVFKGRDARTTRLRLGLQACEGGVRHARQHRRARRCNAHTLTPEVADPLGPSAQAAVGGGVLVYAHAHALGSSSDVTGG